MVSLYHLFVIVLIICLLAGTLVGCDVNSPNNANTDYTILTLSGTYSKTKDGNTSFFEFKEDGTFKIGSGDLAGIDAGTYTFDGKTAILSVTNSEYRDRFFQGQTNTEISVSADYNELTVVSTGSIFKKDSVPQQQPTETDNNNSYNSAPENDSNWDFLKGKWEYRYTYTVEGQPRTIIEFDL